MAIGLCLGRIGYFLNGCCFGNVACTDCPAVHFPLCSPPRYVLVERGLQTAAGFTVEADFRGPVIVADVEPGSPAAASDLRAGDTIVEADGRNIATYGDLWDHLVGSWPRGETRLTLTVRHAGTTQPTVLETFRPLTLGLHPTQLYESISTFFLLLLLLAYYPFRKHYGDVFVLLLLLYRYIGFLTRCCATTPIRRVWHDGSQNGSIVMLLAGIGLMIGFGGNRDFWCPSDSSGRTATSILAACATTPTERSSEQDPDDPGRCR